MKEIDFTIIKKDEDLEIYTKQEIEELDVELDVLLERDGDDIELTEKEYKQIKKVQKLIATKLGGAYQESIDLEKIEKQVANLLCLSEPELTEDKIIYAINNSITLLKKGIPIDTINFECMPPPSGYESKWLVIQSFPEKVDSECIFFPDLEDILERKLSDQEKDDAITYYNEIISSYEKAKRK